jgi:hypothetical protein
MRTPSSPEARGSLRWATAKVIARWEAEGRLGEFASPDGEDRFWLEVVDLLAAPTPEREARKPLEFLALVEECEVA